MTTILTTIDRELISYVVGLLLSRNPFLAMAVDQTHKLLLFFSQFYFLRKYPQAIMKKKTSEQKKTKQQQNGPILVWTLLSYYQFSLMSAVSSSVIPKNHAGLFSICLSHCSDSIENHRGTKFCLHASIKFQAHFTLKQ